MKGISERLLVARKMAGISLQELADKVSLVHPISRQAIHQFEQGKTNPEPSTLLAIAKALGVDINFFFREHKVSFGKIEYRKKVKLSKTEEISIQEKSKDILERYFELESITNSFLHFSNPLGEFLITNNSDIEKAADTLREKWELGTKPIPSVLEMLEEKGIKIVEIPTTDGFQGFCAKVDEQIIIVLNQNDNSVRKRFTALHELGHILLKFSEEIDIEKACHYFAGALLFPKKSVIESFSAKRHKIALVELIQLKEYYGISIQAMLIRLKHLAIINETTYKSIVIWLSKSKQGGKNEPGEFRGDETPIRFNQLLYRAAVEEIVSLSKAASIANISLTTLRRKLAGL
ncbi:helix-turn-helix domain-containing protein [Flectobacillus roseus]|uniref:XRE family transcriptional regulator n=1 Tax=Flectobacillus roseus TaxID=502259 RepID=A0ABT6Y6Y8_9BACT|nr:XRE family transcriptional regulator [Flectobacillus roseus]MDI9859334.1 XRE family transcriptional regulator [Flectobacillus roseus]